MKVGPLSRGEFVRRRVSESIISSPYMLQPVGTGRRFVGIGAERASVGRVVVLLVVVVERGSVPVSTALGQDYTFPTECGGRGRRVLSGGWLVDNGGRVGGAEAVVYIASAMMAG